MTNESENNKQEFLFSLNDAVKIDIDVDALNSYKEELNALLSEYANIVNPLIVEYEVEKNEFPIEMLNEIRAIVGHIVRATATKDDKEISENIRKAHSHVKRATLDGYKYLCVIYDERYWDFFARYDTVDWVDSGLQEDVHNINENRRKAVELLRKAKNSEGVENDSQRLSLSAKDHYESMETLSKMYKRAYNEYRALFQMLYLLDEKMATLAKQKKLITKRKYGLLSIFGRANDR